MRMKQKMKRTAAWLLAAALVLTVLSSVGEKYGQEAEKWMCYFIFDSAFSIIPARVFPYPNHMEGYAYAIDDGRYVVKIRGAKGCMAYARYVTKLMYGTDASGGKETYSDFASDYSQGALTDGGLTDGKAGKTGTTGTPANTDGKGLPTDDTANTDPTDEPANTGDTETPADPTEALQSEAVFRAFIATLVPGDHLRIAKNNHSVTFVTADDSGFYVLSYHGDTKGTVFLDRFTYDGFMDYYKASVYSAGSFFKYSGTYTAQPGPDPVDPTAGYDMYRVYNPNSGEHFYTKDAAERDALVEEGWNAEGIAWKAPGTGEPVYRYYSTLTGDHFYTKDLSEGKEYEANGWKYEGVCWYSAPEGTAVYRQMNPNATGRGRHNFTADVSERDTLVSLGWVDEGTGWYGL